MDTYGIPYHGSKSRIAKWVVGLLPASDCLVDLFAGGCAVTHAALLSGKWGRVVANDIGPGPQVFVDAANGEFEGFATVPTREEFKRTDDDVLKLLYSFGNNRTDYLWSSKLEAVKVEASKMVSAPSMRERRTHYKAFMRELGAYVKAEGRLPDKMDGSHHGVLQGLEGLERLQGLERLERLEVTRLDYREVEVPDGATVYADPPYRGTDNEGHGGEFDFAAFDGWLASVDFPVYVSEFTCPAGCVEVASRERKQSMAANGKSPRVTERLFVQERFAAEEILSAPRGIGHHRFDAHCPDRVEACCGHCRARTGSYPSKAKAAAAWNARVADATPPSRTGSTRRSVGRA